MEIMVVIQKSEKSSAITEVMRSHEKSGEVREVMRSHEEGAAIKVGGSYALRASRRPE